MRVLDCLRLGFAGVKAHKKRAVAVMIIVGLLFGVTMAGAFILQGLENVVLSEMLEPTDGKILVVSNVETGNCRENCDIPAEITRIKDNIQRYGGESIALKIIQTSDGTFYNVEGVSLMVWVAILIEGRCRW